MEISNLSIKKLNGKYDFSIDLSRQCTILVGANGVGKTTVLRIIEILNMFSFFELLQFNFDSISFGFDIENTKHTLCIRYEDLLPDCSLFAKRIMEVSAIEIRNTSMKDFDEHELEESLVSLQKDRCLNKYVYDILNNREISDYISARMKVGYLDVEKYVAIALEGMCAFGEYPEPMIVRESKLDNDLIQLRNSLEKAGINLELHADIERKRSYYFSMINSIDITSDKYRTSLIVSDMLKWLSSYESEFGNTSDECIKRLPKQWGFFFHTMLVGAALNADEILLKAYTRALRTINDFRFERYVEPKYEWPKRTEINGDYRIRKNRHHPFEYVVGRTKDIDQIEIESLICENKLSIDNLITRYYYTDEFQISINLRACQFMADLLDGNIPIPSDDVVNTYMQDKYNDDSFFQKCKEYINPVISAQTGVFGNRVERHFSSKEWTFAEEPTAMGEYYVNKFIDSVMDEFFDEANINPKISELKRLFDKYYTDKSVEILPEGIKIYDRTDSERKSPIDVAVLSSGEKKILILLLISLFGESLKVYIDEPELSLSITWQEEILKDVISNGNCKIVVATHSPYMAGTEEMTKCVAYVPN